MDEDLHEFRQIAEAQRVADQARQAQNQELLAMLRSALGDPILMRLYGHVVVEATLADALARNTEALLRTIADIESSGG